MKVSMFCSISNNKKQFLSKENPSHIQLIEINIENNPNNLTITVSVIIFQVQKKVSTTQFKGQVQRLLHLLTPTPKRQSLTQCHKIIFSPQEIASIKMMQ
jgi:hypothetical protein